MCKNEVLKVQMLGGFSIMYGDRLITLKKNPASKLMQLLQLLLYKKETGVPRKELIEILYGRGGLSDPSNNLRVSVHRLRRQMAEAGLPEEEYIKIVNGVYTWSSSVPTIIDVLEFHSLTEKAKDEKNPEKKAELQKKALELYQGDFLPKLSGEDWVLLEAVKYKNEYEETLQEVLEYQERCENFEEMLRLSASASDLYPFDEWQRYKIEALMGMGRDEEAMQVYQDTSRLFFEELGIQPSERMIHQFREMSKRIRNVPKAMPDIKGGLQEKGEETGAYYCSLPSFIDGYRLIRRIIRDANFRGCLPERTLSMWKNVVRGEDRYIRPFRLEADFWLDSIHLYEPFVYRKPFLDLTREDSLSGESRVQVEKLAESLRKFPEMPLSLVPKDSLLREFLILP